MAALLTISEVQARLTPVFKRHQVMKAILFGSTARGSPPNGATLI
jgi:predicted nucleotidyltransferase